MIEALLIVAACFAPFGLFLIILLILMFMDL